MFGLVEIGERMRKAAGADARAAGDGEVLAGLRALPGIRACLDAVEGHLLAEADVRQVTDRDLGLSTAAWWSRQAGLPMGAARSRVSVARRLHDELNEVDDALVGGRVSWEHARVLDHVCNPRVADRVAAIQPELVDLTRGALFEAWRRDVRDPGGPGRGT